MSPSRSQARLFELPRKSHKPDESFERDCIGGGYSAIAGVDEAGRGPLAGPVVAAAVILDLPCAIKGINDSKKLKPEKRAELIEIIKEKAVAWAVGIVDPAEIDRINILQATLQAMKIALNGLSKKPDFALVDGISRIHIDLPQKLITKGDSRCLSIAAASIVAKVTRDEIMKEIDKLYPQYGFAKHFGYSTDVHREAIARYKPCPAHRMTFGGVKEYMELCTK